MLAPNSSVSPMGIRAKWYYLFFLTLIKYCQISQGSTQGPRLVNLCIQLKPLPCVRKLLHPLLNGKLYCLLGTLTDCSVALVKSRSMVTIPPFSGGKQFLCGGQNNEADYKELLMGITEKRRTQKGGLKDSIELIHLVAAASSWGVSSQMGRGWNAGTGCSWDYFQDKVGFTQKKSTNAYKS